MKTAIGRRTDTDCPITGVMTKLMKQMRRLNKAQKLLRRKEARALKKLEQESYDWSILDA